MKTVGLVDWLGCCSGIVAFALLFAFFVEKVVKKREREQEKSL